MGELLGLRWQDINLEQGALKINQALWHGRLVPPKTQGSARTVVMGRVLPGILREHLRNSLHARPEDFAFCRPDGSPLRPDVLRKDVLYPVLDRLGIPHYSRRAGFHSFRHSAGSFVNTQTGNLKLAQKLLGQSNLSTTADIYTHTSEETEREAALALERAVFGDLFPSVLKAENGNPAVN